MSSLFIAARRLNYECILESSGQVKYKPKISFTILLFWPNFYWFVMVGKSWSALPYPQNSVSNSVLFFNDNVIDW